MSHRLSIGIRCGLNRHWFVVLEKVSDISEVVTLRAGWLVGWLLLLLRLKAFLPSRVLDLKS